MTLDRQRGLIIFECDGCNETLDTDESDWTEAKHLFDQERWQAEKTSAGWWHWCPRCQEK